MHLKDLLGEAVRAGASDIHLGVGLEPTMRNNGEIVKFKHPVLASEDVHRLVGEAVGNAGLAQLQEKRELNMSFTVEGLSRFRLNAYYERGTLGAAIRVVYLKVGTLADLGLPPIVEGLTMRPHGLVIITGAVGMGKTTTMAAMIDAINRNGKPSRIITIEDPIEYLHSHNRSTIIQREVGTDTTSFAEALRQVLRQDPNIICVGEMRDLETISTALIAAETGHLVLATLHTQDAAQTINRIVDVFPPGQQEQTRTQLAYTLQGIICQKLLPRANGKGRVLAVEILVANMAVRNIVRKMDINQLYTVISTGADQGMTTMDKSLKKLVDELVISYETAMEHAKNPKDFKFL